MRNYDDDILTRVESSAIKHNYKAITNPFLRWYRQDRVNDSIKNVNSDFHIAFNWFSNKIKFW